jgi:methylase of polypeptide subunit release factors
VHSAYPTKQDDAVFFGPDTYRFARFIQQGLATRYLPVGLPIRILDVGCGSGAGGVVAARALAHSGPLEVTMNDINPLALQYTAVNAAFADIAIKPALGNAFRAVKGAFDLIISNPPYLDDAAQRAYRHGGADLGRALSVRIGQEALARLAPGGRLLLYTGVAMVAGVDAFLADMQPLLADPQFDWSYAEIDPDVFGEELEQPVYAHIDRIAAVGLTVTRKLGAL